MKKSLSYILIFLLCAQSINTSAFLKPYLSQMRTLIKKHGIGLNKNILLTSGGMFAAMCVLAYLVSDKKSNIHNPIAATPKPLNNSPKRWGRKNLKTGKITWIDMPQWLLDITEKPTVSIHDELDLKDPTTKSTIHRIIEHRFQKVISIERWNELPQEFKESVVGKNYFEEYEREDKIKKHSKDFFETDENKNLKCELCEGYFKLYNGDEGLLNFSQYRGDYEGQCKCKRYYCRECRKANTNECICGFTEIRYTGSYRTSPDYKEIKPGKPQQIIQCNSESTNV